MMRFDIMTLFPALVDNILAESIIGRAQKSGAIEVFAHNIRDYSEDKHRRVDDTPYGGGMGMLMAAPPIVNCFEAICGMQPANVRRHVVYLSPRGQVFNHAMAKRFAECDDLVLLCGRYEGVDARVLDLIVDGEVSIGDFVLTGGEIPAMAIVDAVSRLIPGVLGDDICFTDESHWNGLLEYPQYSRPDEWHGLSVPEVLRSGDHAKVARWQKKQAILRTLHRRPDLFYKLRFPYKTRAERKFIAELEAEDDAFRDRNPKNLDYRK